MTDEQRGELSPEAILMCSDGGFRVLDLRIAVRRYFMGARTRICSYSSYSPPRTSLFLGVEGITAIQGYRDEIMSRKGGSRGKEEPLVARTGLGVCSHAPELQSISLSPACRYKAGPHVGICRSPCIADGSRQVLGMKDVLLSNTSGCRQVMRLLVPMLLEVACRKYRNVQPHVVAAVNGGDASKATTLSREIRDVQPIAAWPSKRGPGREKQLGASRRRSFMKARST